MHSAGQSVTLYNGPSRSIEWVAGQVGSERKLSKEVTFKQRQE